jgi:hypothetical protein
MKVSMCAPLESFSGVLLGKLFGRTGLVGIKGWPQTHSGNNLHPETTIIGVAIIQSLNDLTQGGGFELEGGDELDIQDQYVGNK